MGDSVTCGSAERCAEGLTEGGSWTTRGVGGWSGKETDSQPEEEA